MRQIAGLVGCSLWVLGGAACLDTQAQEADLGKVRYELTMQTTQQVDEATAHANHGGYAYDRAGTNYDGDDNTGRVSWKNGGYTAGSANQVSTCTYGWCGFPSIGSGCVPGDNDEKNWGYSFGACNSSAWGQRFGGFLDGVDRPAGSGDMVHSNYKEGVSGTTTFGYHPYWSVVYNGDCRTYQGWSYAGHGCGNYVVEDPAECGDGVCATTEGCSSCQADCGVCPDGLNETNLSGGQRTFQMVVPANGESVSIKIAGGSGDADLYVRKGSAPTTSTYDCRSWATGNSESCSFTGPGTYYVLIHDYADYSGVTLTGTYTTSAPPPDPVCGDAVCNGNENCGTCAADCGACIECGDGVCNGSEDCGSCAEDCGTCAACGDGVCNGAEACGDCPSDCGACPAGLHITGLSGGNHTYTMVVPAGGENVVFTTVGSNGDADLYVKRGSAPTTSSYDCRSYSNDSNEQCAMSTGAGTYHVLIRAYSSYTGLTVTGTYDVGTPPSCGDGTCNGSEDCASCSSDCGTCQVGGECMIENTCGSRAPSGCYCDSSCQSYGDCCTNAVSDCNL